MKKKFIVIGDVMLDVYERYTSDRISPEAPVPVAKIINSTFSLGGASNVAKNLALNKLDVTLIGQIGDDDNGKKLKDLCQKANLSIDSLLIKNCKTIVKKRLIVQNQQIVRIDEETFYDDVDVFNEFKKHDIDKNTIVLFSDYNKGFLKSDDIVKIISYAKKYGAKVSVDTKKTDLTPYRSADIITPNLSEFKKICGYTEISNLPKYARIVMKKFDLRSIMITLSSKGLLYVDQDNEILMPTENQEVHDVTGAGDTVFAFWNILIDHDYKIDEKMRICNKAASLSVKNIGNYAVKLSDIIESNNSKICKLNDLKNLSDYYKSNGKIIVGTNGCFDLFHAGHLDSLEFASKQGDKLFVGLNSDKSVKSLKGQNRPIISFEDRARILSSISFVDHVVEIDNEPIEFYRALVPDLLVKGNEYENKKIIGEDIVQNNGGKVIFHKRENKISTSEIINKLRKE